MATGTTALCARGVSPAQIRSCSMLSFMAWIWPFRLLPSLEVTEQLMTGRDTPQARPRATFEGTNTYGTFLSSQRRGRWRRISRGSASAASTMNSAMPRFRVFVASLAPCKEKEGFRYE